MFPFPNFGGEVEPGPDAGLPLHRRLQAGQADRRLGVIGLQLFQAGLAGWAFVIKQWAHAMISVTLENSMLCICLTCEFLKFFLA